jgi:hypothetical protein
MSSSAMLTPPESGESPIVGPREGHNFFAGSNGDGGSVNLHTSQSGQQHIVDGVWTRLAPNESRSRGPSSSRQATNGHPVDSKVAVQQQISIAEQAAAERQITESVAQLVAGFRSNDVGPEKVPQSGVSIPFRGLEYDVVRALRSYVYNEEGSARADEEWLLNRLERVWREDVRADSEKILENVAVFIARERAFLTWIELKRHMAAYERAEQRKSHLFSPSFQEC